MRGPEPPIHCHRMMKLVGTANHTEVPVAGGTLRIHNYRWQCMECRSVITARYEQVEEA